MPFIEHRTVKWPPSIAVQHGSPRVRAHSRGRGLMASAFISLKPSYISAVISSYQASPYSISILLALVIFVRVSGQKAIYMASLLAAIIYSCHIWAAMPQYRVSRWRGWWYQNAAVMYSRNMPLAGDEPFWLVLLMACHLMLILSLKWIVHQHKMPHFDVSFALFDCRRLCWDRTRCWWMMEFS